MIYLKKCPRGSLPVYAGAAGTKSNGICRTPGLFMKAVCAKDPVRRTAATGSLPLGAPAAILSVPFSGTTTSTIFAGVKDGIHLVAVPAVTYYSYGWHHGVRTVTLYERDLTRFSSEILLYSDLVQKKVRNLYMKHHGYAEFRSRFLPKFAGTLAGAALTAGIYAAHKKNKKSN